MQFNQLFNHPSQPIAVKKSVYSWAVTGTFHGSIVDAESEGEARRIFHRYYNGESILIIKKRGNLPAWAYNISPFFIL